MREALRAVLFFFALTTLGITLIGENGWNPEAADLLRVIRSVVVLGAAAVIVATTGIFRWLRNRAGRAVASLSRSARQHWESAIDRIEEVRILAMITRRRRDCGSEFADPIKADTWEVPVCEVVHRPLSGEDE